MNHNEPASSKLEDAALSGMTLRDYLAMAALQGILSAPETDGTFQDFARSAYKFADAMLAEREKQP